MSKFTEKDKQKIVEYYKNGYDCVKIGSFLKTNVTNIRNFLVKLGYKLDKSISRRTYHINDGFFEKINSEEKAYFLGWIMSDGHISLKNQMSIRLQEEDKNLLILLRDLISSNCPLKFISFKNTNNSHWKNQFGLEIYNKKICEDLRKLGLDNRKSQTAKFPRFLNENLLPYFIRGLFEGDGCLSINYKKCKSNINGHFPTKVAQFLIAGTEDICKGLKVVFNKLKIKSSIRKTQGCYTVYIYGNKNIFSILNWIYKDHQELKLDRKFALFKELQKIESRDKTKDLDCKKIPIKQLDLEGKLIKIWPSAVNAVKSLGQTNTGSLVAVLKKRKYFKTYKGFKWEYLNQSKN